MNTQQLPTEGQRKKAMMGHLAAGIVAYVAAVGLFVVLPHTFENGGFIGFGVGIGVGLAMMAFQLHMLRPGPEDSVLGSSDTNHESDGGAE